MWRQIDYLANRKDRVQRSPDSRRRASFQGSRTSGGAAAPQEPAAVGFQPGPHNRDLAWAGHQRMGQINPFFRPGTRPAVEQQTIAPWQWLAFDEQLIERRMAGICDLGARTTSP